MGDWDEYDARPNKVTALQWRWKKANSESRDLDDFNILHSKSTRSGLLIADDGCQHLIKDRQYLVLSDDGELTIMCPETFNFHYKKVGHGYLGRTQ